MLRLLSPIRNTLTINPPLQRKQREQKTSSAKPTVGFRDV